MKHRRLKRIIKAGGGGTFRGVGGVPAWPARKQRAYLLVYFDSPKTGTTLTMRVRGLTAEKVNQHIKESNKHFGAEE